MAFREEFEQSISQGMKLTKRMFLNILACDISTSGYADRVLDKLESVGGTKAKEYYKRVKDEWQREHDAQMKSVAHWYKGQCENEWENTKRKAVRESRKEQEVEHMKAGLQQKSDRELVILLQRLKQNDA